MKCILCNKTEKEYLKSKSAHVSKVKRKIKGTIKIINADIVNLQKIHNEKHDSKLKASIDYSKECGSLNKENCKMCIKCEPIDDMGYFWCSCRRKSFKMYAELFKLKKLEGEKKILNARIETMEKTDNDFFVISYEKDIYGNNEYFAVCPCCKMVIEKISENKISERFNVMMGIIDGLIREKTKSSSHTRQ